ncbi:MAG: DUF4294 domain-containing protein [Ginsengibacter sp.]|jgi:hypothetical protein
MILLFYKFTSVMRIFHIPYQLVLTFFLIGIFVGVNSKTQAQSRYGINDTITTYAIIYEGDTLTAQTLAGVYVWKKSQISKEEWTRLRNAVYVTYPYAKKAGYIFVDIQKHIAGSTDKVFIRKYINSREKELKKEFTTPLKNLSVYQGKVLMKLINRETNGVDCYNIVKELKGGFTARFWQTIAFFFGGDLKQPYDAAGKDAVIELIVHEVQRMYGYSS